MIFIDTCNTQCVVAGSSNKNYIIYESPSDKKNTDVVLSYIEKACSVLDSNINQITNIIVTVGPGSFTGSRVGIIIAQIIAQYSKAMIHPITTSCALAYSAFYQYGFGVYAILQDARMNELYFSVYDFQSSNPKVIKPDSRLSICDIDKLSGYDFVIRNFNFDKFTYLKIDPIALLNNLNNFTEVNPDSINALYLRDPV